MTLLLLTNASVIVSYDRKAIDELALRLIATLLLLSSLLVASSGIKVDFRYNFAQLARGVSGEWPALLVHQAAFE